MNMEDTSMRFGKYMPACLLAIVPVPVCWGQTLDVTANTTIACDNMLFEGFDVTVSGATLTVDCSHTFNSLTINANGVVTHSAGGTVVIPGDPPVGMDLTITNNVTINA